MPKIKKHIPDDGEVFVIPLEGQKYFGIGEVLKVTPDALNSVICIFYSHRFSSLENLNIDELSDENVISVQFITPDLIESRIWKVVGENDPYDPEDFLNFKELESDGFIGVDIIGSGNIRKFLSAYHGLLPWNCMYKEEYFDELLYPGVERPENIFFSQKQK